MKKVVFILDTVTHYHQELLQTIEKELKAIHIKLYLISGKTNKKQQGRISVNNKVITNEVNYTYQQLKLFNLTLRYQRNIIKLLKTINPDTVIMSSHVGNISCWQIMHLKKLLHFKLIAWQCGYEYNPSKLKDLLLRQFIKGFDHHLAYHTNAQKYALRYGAKKNQITVMHNTINESTIKRADKKSAKTLVMSEYPNISSKKIILFVGAILKEKNLAQLCSAMNIIDSNESVLIIVGDGPYLAELKTAFSLQKNIIFAGRIVDKVGLFFSAADLFILPGTGGLAINEAMAHTLPVITGYADGSADDLVVHGHNGLRLKNNSAKEIAHCINRLLNKPNEMRAMGLNSRKIIDDNFTYSNFTSTIIDTLKSK